MFSSAPSRSASACVAEAWAEDVYKRQVYVRSFVDHDGDGHGDLAGLAAKLDHFRTLGVDGLRLMPIYAGPSLDGYAVQSLSLIHICLVQGRRR